MRRASASLLLLSAALAAPPVAAKKPAAAPAGYAQVVRAAVDSRLGDLVACVDTSKIKKGTPSIKLDVRLVVLSDGKVLSATQARTAKAPKGKPAPDPAIEKCLLDTIGKWTFDAPPGRQTVAIDFPIEMSFEAPSGKK